MLLVFSTVIAISTSSTTYQSLRYNEVKELVGNFNEDFNRALRNVLASMTQEYNQSAEIEIPREHAFGNFTLWMKTAIRTFASRGIQLNFSLPQEWLFNDTQGYRYAEDLVKLYWYSPKSISSILASCTIDIPGLGFYGWKEENLLFLNMTIDTGSITNINDKKDPGYDSTRVNVMVNREGGVPVDGLASSNFKVMYFDTGRFANGTAINSWQDGTIFLLLNNGGGNYTIYFKTNSSNPVPEPYNKYLMIWVQDTRGIIVEAYTYTYIDFTIDERAIGLVSKPYETYTFEMLHNGTLLWFGRQLAINGSYVPLPLPPVKQFRVNVTVNGALDTNMPLSLSQVEVWTPDYSAPTLNFSNWKSRFIVGDKLVFFVNYGPASVTSQRVRVSWLTDADASPPNYLLQFQNLSNQWVVNNGVYRIGFAAYKTSPSDPVGIDWNIQVNSTDNSANMYHVEYRLFNYDVAPSGSLNYRIPWGSGSSQGWSFLQGPVRAVAYRNSDVVLYAVPSPGTPHTGELNHTEIVLISYGVNYFQTYFTARTLKDLTITQNVVYVTTFSGTNDGNSEPNVQFRLNYGSVQKVNSAFGIDGIVNGRFSSSDSVYNIYAGAGGNPATAKEIGWWTTTYSPLRGQATFYDNKTIVALKSRNLAAMFLWTTGNGYKRDVRLDWAYYDPSNTNFFIPSGTIFSYKMAGWYYAPGGSLGTLQNNPTDWMNEQSSWTSTGDDIPNLYYNMTVGGNLNPWVTSIRT